MNLCQLGHILGEDIGPTTYDEHSYDSGQRIKLNNMDKSSKGKEATAQGM